MNKTLAISVIVVVTVILTIGYVVPQVAATHDSSHKKSLYLAGEISDVCGPSGTGAGSQCDVVIDINRNGLCDLEDRTIQLPHHIASTLPQCPVGHGS